MVFLVRFTCWFLVPFLLVLSIWFNDANLATISAVAMWVVPSVIGPLNLVSLLAMLSVKPSDEKWKSSADAVLKAKPGFLAAWFGRVALILVVALSAYTGFVVTAFYYAVGAVWSQMCNWMIRTHFENGGEK